MKHATHPALILIENFCTHYNNRDMKELISLFSKKATIKFWDCEEIINESDRIKRSIQDSWKASIKSQLSISSAPIVSNLPSCWALSLFTLTTETSNELFTYQHFKGNLYGIKEGNNWKINEIRFVSK